MRMPINPLRSMPGATPGIEHDEIEGLPSGAEPAHITCVDYSPTNVAFQEVTDLDDFVAHHRPEWSGVRWIHVDGLADMNAIHALANKYNLHPLAIEDMLHVTQRPKIESYGGEDTEIQARLFIVTRIPNLSEGRLDHRQVSIFLGHKTVLTFQEAPNNAWDAIRQRLKTKGSRLRKSDASFLAYSLLDAIVDHCFPILEYFGDRAEDLEAQILENPLPGMINDIHQFKRDLLLLRWAMWPMREVVSLMQREEHECIAE